MRKKLRAILDHSIDGIAAIIAAPILFIIGLMIFHAFGKEMSRHQEEDKDAG